MRPLSDQIGAWSSARDVALARWKGKTEGIMQRAPAMVAQLREATKRSNLKQFDTQADLEMLKLQVELLKTECDFLRELDEANAEAILAIGRHTSDARTG